MPSLALGIPQHRFSFPLRGVPTSFLFRFRRLSDTSATSCSFVVDKLFPYAYSSHSSFSTSAVVGRAFTYSMFSFHNSPRFIPTSRTISQAHSCLSTLFRLPLCQFRSPFQSMLSRLELVWSYSELDCRRRQVTLHFACVTSRFWGWGVGFWLIWSSMGWFVDSIGAWFVRGVVWKRKNGSICFYGDLEMRH